jgi:prolipoprotein diacylglyceryl transferase
MGVVISGSAFAFIPSPSANGLRIGPLFVHAYGLAYVFAVIAAIVIARRRWERLGGSRELVNEVALWGFPAGLAGGRIYFLITSWDQVPKHWWGPIAIWQGGLGIWGGIAAGTLVGLWVLRRRGAMVAEFMDAAAPALLVAQAIGRIGNYFNQELFGGPTTLPWGLEIDPAHRPAGYSAYATFHPTFLYEMIWNLGLAGFLVWLGARRRIRAPGLFALYVAGYSGFRIFEELLRVDPAHRILGLRVNFYVASVLFLAGLVWFVAIQRGRGVPARGAGRGAALLGLAWVVGVAAGCGQSGAGGAVAMGPGRVIHASGAPARLHICATSDHGRVFTTSAAVSHARLAVATPYRATSNPPTRCASQLIRIRTPAAAAARAWTSLRSRRSGLALISSIVPVRAAASITRSISTA